MRYSFHISVFVFLLLLSSCNRCIDASGPSTSRFSESDSVGEFILDMVADVVVRVDSNRDNIIETIAQEDVHPAVISENIAGQLTISLDECLQENSPILVDLILNEAHRFTIESAGLIESNSIIEQPDIWFNNRGLGDLDFVIDTEHVIGEIRSSGNLILAGECSRFDFLTTSSGDLRGYNMIADTVVLNIFGSTVCDVYANQYLEVNFFSEGRVNYRGNPSTLIVNGDGQVTETTL